MPGVQAYCQLNAATTVTMPYGISTEVRTSPRAKIVRCMTKATAKPSTSSIVTETTVITTVTPKACHHRPVEVRIVT